MWHGIVVAMTVHEWMCYQLVLGRLYLIFFDPIIQSYSSNKYAHQHIDHTQMLIYWTNTLTKQNPYKQEYLTHLFPSIDSSEWTLSISLLSNCVANSLTYQH